MPLPVYAIGDWVQDIVLPSVGGKIVKLSDTVGVPAVLLFFGSDATQASAATAACSALAAEHAAMAALNAVVLAITTAAAGTDTLDGTPPPDESTKSPAGNDLPFPMLIDADQQVSQRYGAARLRAVLVNANARVTRYYDNLEPGPLAAALLADLKKMVELEPARHMVQQAPILLIPDVVPPEFCAKLINTWEKEGNQDSGFMVNDGDKTVGKFDYGSKIRRDHFIKLGSDIDKEARQWVGRHILPEIGKAFNYEVTRLEDMKIACYDANRGGYFRPHRDNTTSATAHRRFAVSILLNDDYGGGYLRFPEYGPHLYRPSAGGAAVFGCSLLHEATDVTAGRRFVLLTFLYGDKEAKMREEYAKRTGGGYRA